MFVLDSHCDTPSQMVEGRDLTIDNELAHIDIPKLQRGGVDAAFFALYIPAEMDTDAAYTHACNMYDAVVDMINSNPDKVALTVSEDQAYENKAKGLISIFLGLENASPIGDSLERVREFYDKGVRYITLCHSQDNLICDSCASEVKTWNGLSPFGREVVAEMNRLGMLVDVSHISDEAFYDVIKYSKKPVVATHSCCRALADHPRNMTDDMIRTLAANGGVIQINFYPLFLDGSFKNLPDSEEVIPSYKVIADHIDHVVKLVGIDHVGIGSDFDGIDVTPDGMDDISQMPKLFEELRFRGYSEEALSKLASKNFFNAFSFSDAVQ
jgi:membrane dipeptidase